MIQANTTIFTSLDHYCLSRDETVSNAGKPRWIATNGYERQVLMHAVLTDAISFSSSLKIARYDFMDRALIVTSGFDPQMPISVGDADEPDGGLLTAFLSDTNLEPAASPARIRDVIEAGDKDSAPHYSGHHRDLIASLYPEIRVFSIKGLLKEETFKTFFLICLADRRCVDQWIDPQLASTLGLVTTLSPTVIPYETLCRSILDVDPSALYLAMYRCLEALYAHKQTTGMMNAIGFSMPWVEMAELLENTLGWYPREEPSLENLLKHAVPDDLRAVVSALNAEVPAGARIESFAAKRIYEARNSLVHYRPFHRRFPFSDVNWNRACEAMSLLVLHIYGQVA